MTDDNDQTPHAPYGVLTKTAMLRKIQRQGRRIRPVAAHVDVDHPVPLTVASRRVDPDDNEE